MGLNLRIAHKSLKERIHQRRAGEGLEDVFHQEPALLVERVMFPSTSRT